jgi:hypothetical protein
LTKFGRKRFDKIRREIFLTKFGGKKQGTDLFGFLRKPSLWTKSALINSGCERTVEMMMIRRS